MSPGHGDALERLVHDLHQVIAHLPSAIYVCEAPSGLIRLSNARAVELWGRAPEPGDTDERVWDSFRLFRPDGRPLPHAATPMAEALRGGAGLDEEVVIERPDGSRVALHVDVAPLRDPEGRIVGAINVFPDLPDRRRLEAPLDLAERTRAEVDAARLAAIVASADDAIVGKTLSGAITSWNRAAEAMFGYTADDVIGRPITVIVPLERLDEETDILNRLARGETVQHLETQRLTRDGRRLDVSLTVSPIRDARGRVVGVSTIARDITEQKRGEAQRRAHVEALELLYRLTGAIARAGSPEEICEAAVDAVKIAGRADRASVLVVDPDGVMRFKAWRGLSEAYRAAVEGHSPWSPGTVDAAPILVSDVLAEPALAPLRDVIEAEGIRAVGFIPLVHHRRVLGKFMVYYDAPHLFTAEETRLAETVARHVAFGLVRAQAEAANEALLERERAARREADAARADAERANRSKDEFLAMLAHELRNPLSVIVNANAVLGAWPLDPRADRARTIIRRQSQHLTRMLDDLLDVARITSGRIELEHDRVDLRAVLEHAVESQRHQIDAKRQRLATALPGGPVVVMGDPVRLQQVFSNLVNNAAKYTPAGGHIWLGLDTDADGAVVRVRDDGAGIPSDKLDTIFELFAQANPTLARTEGGLGVGLTLVKRLVELHGGSIRASSDGAGRGAEFVVRLPRAGHASEPAAPAAAPAGGPGRRILVVEDHDDGREMLATTLRSSGHEVFVAATGGAAVEEAALRAPDVVLIDIGLPDIDGYEVAQRVRGELGQAVRLVALTGYGQPRDRVRSARSGFDAHLVKPVEPARLVEVLRGVCAR